MKKFFKEFKEFISRGNVLDLAVGVIIGGAFKDIVNSLVNDLISPVIGLVFKADFKDLVIKVKDAVVDPITLEELEPALEIRYGAFITGVINFLIMAFVVFLIVKGVNTLANLAKKKEEPAPIPEPTTKICPYCCSEISIEATRCPHCTSQLD
ncbi:MAG: large conductance mechanosensitive channel protein MscL [Clostridiales bacterium]|nr:large conductance mechanosensitive channel protein MscL [Clostridiales bacterium]